MKPDHVMIASFLDSGAFHPDTQFWRSDRKDGRGNSSYWNVYCPVCNGQGESYSGSLRVGNKSCHCSSQRQQECYINLIVDDSGHNVAIKFGIANNSFVRIKKQNRLCKYSVVNYVVYNFSDTKSCRIAERECLQELECGVVLKRDMPDGYTETTWIYNLDKIIEIYERNGGIKIDQ